MLGKKKSQNRVFKQFPTNQNANWTYGPNIENCDNPPFKLHRLSKKYNLPLNCFVDIPVL